MFFLVEGICFLKVLVIFDCIFSLVIKEFFLVFTGFCGVRFFFSCIFWIFCFFDLGSVFLFVSEFCLDGSVLRFDDFFIKGVFFGRFIWLFFFLEGLRFFIELFIIMRFRGDGFGGVFSSIEFFWEFLNVLLWFCFFL